MAWLEDATEEFKKLDKGQKIAVGVVFAGVAALGLFEYKKGKTSGSTVNPASALSNGLAGQALSAGGAGGSTGAITQNPQSNLIDAIIRPRGSLLVNDPNTQAGINSWEQSAAGIPLWSVSGQQIGSAPFGQGVQIDPNAVQIQGTSGYKGEGNTFFKIFQNGTFQGYANEGDVKQAGYNVSTPTDQQSASTTTGYGGGAGRNTYTVQPGDIFPEIAYKLGIKNVPFLASKNQHVNVNAPQPGQVIQY